MCLTWDWRIARVAATMRTCIADARVVALLWHGRSATVLHGRGKMSNMQMQCLGDTLRKCNSCLSQTIKTDMLLSERVWGQLPVTASNPLPGNCRQLLGKVSSGALKTLGRTRSRRTLQSGMRPAGNCWRLPATAGARCRARVAEFGFQALRQK